MPIDGDSVYLDYCGSAVCEYLSSADCRAVACIHTLWVLDKKDRLRSKKEM